MSHVEDIRDWIYGIVTPMPVIIAPYNGPVPTSDYIAIQVLDSMDDDFPPVIKQTAYVTDEETEEVSEDPDNIVYWTQIDSELMVSVNVYASDGLATHAKIKARANLPPVRLTDDSSIRPVLARAGNVRDLTFLDDTSNAPRYQCDYYFRVGYTEEVTQPRVKRIVVNGTLNEDTSQEMQAEADVTMETAE